MQQYGSQASLRAGNSIHSSSVGENSLRQENEKLKQYIQAYETQIKDLESELSQLHK